MEWDYQHGEIEKWNKRGTKHKGSFDLDTGEPIEGKGPGTKKGGGVFKNREGNLPSKDSKGNPITYTEYDVNPTKAGSTRDAARLVKGSNGKVYYTKDHYKTFTEIKD